MIPAMDTGRLELQEMREEQVLVDFTIIIGCEVFRVHQIVLAAHSRYFKAMFANEWSENVERSVTFDDIEPKIFERILHYCYTWSIDLRSDDVVHVITVASRLQIPNLMSICSTYAIENLDISNSLPLLSAANLSALAELELAALDYAKEYFPDLIGTEEICSIGPDILEKLIKQDALNIVDEMQVYEVVIKWISFDVENRKEHLFNLLQAVRLVQLDPKKLVDINNQDIIHESPTCAELVLKSMYYQLLESKPNSKLEIQQGLPTEPRTVCSERIYLFGGVASDDQPLMSYDIYDYRLSNPLLLKRYTYEAVECARSDFGIAALGDIIYLIGGKCDGQLCRTNLSFNRRTKKWSSSIAPLPVPRYGLRTIVVDNFIYALGGFIDVTGSSVYRFRDRYDPKKNTWSTYDSQDLRTNFGVVKDERYVYIAGGLESGSIDNMCHKFENEISANVHTSTMIIARQNFGLCFCRGILYAIGGSNGQNALNSVEVYNQNTNLWEMISPLNGMYEHIQAVVNHGIIFVFGYGMADPSVERYDPDIGKWEKISVALTARSNFGLVVA